MQDKSTDKQSLFQQIRNWLTLDKILTTIFATIIGWAIFIKVSPQFGAGLIVFGICVGFIWVLRRQWPKETIARIANSTKLKKPLIINVFLILILLLVLICTPIWGLFVNYSTPSSVKTVNGFINTNAINSVNTAYDNGLIIEFGVNFSDEDLNANLELNGNYQIISEFWDSPGLQKPSSSAIPLNGTIIIKDLGSDIQLGKAQIIKHNITPPNYAIDVKAVTLTTTRSFYVVFGSNDTLLVKTAKLGNTIFVPSGNKMIPK